jgi:hypothetical protein
MIEDVVTPTGPYRLRLMCRAAPGTPLADGSTATAWQRPDGRVVVRAATEAGTPRLGSCWPRRRHFDSTRDSSATHYSAHRSPVVGYRPLRLATVTHAALRAMRPADEARRA